MSAATIDTHGAGLFGLHAADWVTIAASFIATLAGTLALRRWLIAASMMDIPNERSSHATPVPRGGGVVFVAAILAVIALAVGRGAMPASDLAAAAGIAAVAAIGFLDDRRSVGAAPRLAVHMTGGAAAIWAATQGLRADGAMAIAPDAAGIAAYWPVGVVLLLALASAWCVNLVNFMDGIDGMAAFGGALVLASAAGMALCSESPAPTGLVAATLAIAAAVAGFGLVNMSRWRIFMGDAGSGALGLAIAWSLASLAAQGALDPLAAIALPAVLVSDATATLAVRIVRGEHPARAHRTHAYQRLVRAGWTHRSVTAAFAAAQLVLAVPVAWHAQRGGALALPAVVALYAVLAGLALLLGAGREPAEQPHGAT
jgi:Fuc2NAc and GlcNAc transferase